MPRSPNSGRCIPPPSLIAFRRAEESDKSWSNTLEAQLAICIVRCLLERFPDQLGPSAIGIIAPYNGQVLPAADALPHLARAPCKAPSPCPVQGPLALPRCTAVCPPQVRHIRRLLAEAFGEEQAALLEVGSVDGFQGREKEVIIMSAWLGSGLGLG